MKQKKKKWIKIAIASVIAVLAAIILMTIGITVISILFSSMI